MNFSICIIAKNEENTLPRLLTTLQAYRNAGGHVYLLDTGSSDTTVKVAKEWGCNVFESTAFSNMLSPEQVEGIDARHGNTELFHMLDPYFDFASARNYITDKAETDWVYIVDADETLEVFDFKKMDAMLSENDKVIMANSRFYFSGSQNFFRCACYRKSHVKYVGIVHEAPYQIVEGQFMSISIGPEILKSVHKQDTLKPRGQYLTGLFVDLLERPDNPRVNYYCGREFMYRGKYKEAIKLFDRCLGYSKFDGEIAWSHLYIADCYAAQKEFDLMVHHLHLSFGEKAFRTPLVKLAKYYREIKDWQRCLCYASAAIEIPDTEIFMREEEDYTHGPYDLRYLARYYMGDVAGAREDFARAVGLNPDPSKYEQDKQFIYGETN